MRKNTLSGIRMSDADFKACQENWSTHQSTIVTSLDNGKFVPTSSVGVRRRLPLRCQR